MLRVFQECTSGSKKQLIPYKDKGSRQSKRSPWLNYKLLSLITTKREAYQKCQNPLRNSRAFPRCAEMQIPDKIGIDQLCQKLQETVQ